MARPYEEEAVPRGIRRPAALRRGERALQDIYATGLAIAVVVQKLLVSDKVSHLWAIVVALEKN